jgi:hypothetical protein
MVSLAQAAQAKINAQKSTGPRTPQGKARSCMNAMKHGLRSKRVAEQREASRAFEERYFRWMRTGRASDDIDEYLMYRNVVLSVELEQVDRARASRSVKLVDSAAEADLDAVEELGARLFFNPAGGAELYGNSPAQAELSTRRRTSWDGQPAFDNDPSVLVRRLEATHLGTVWLLEQFELLRNQLDSPGFSLPHERFKFIRLLGREPVHSIDDLRVAVVFVAGHALRPAAKHAFIDLASDMDATQLKRHRKRVQARFPDLFRDQGPPEYKQMLVDLVDENIDRLSTLLREHEANAEEHAEQTYNRLQFDPSPEGSALRNHWIRCTDRLQRGFETYRKYQSSKRRRQTNDQNNDDKDQGAAADSWPFEELNGARRAAHDDDEQSRTRSRPQSDRSLDADDDYDEPDDDSDDWADLERELSAGLPSDLDFGSDDPALIEAEESSSMSDAPHAEAGDHGTSWLAEIPRNLTNEPGALPRDERSKPSGTVGVASKFNATNRLDNSHLRMPTQPRDAEAGTQAAPPRDHRPTPGPGVERERAATLAKPQARMPPEISHPRDPAQAGLTGRGDSIESRIEAAMAQLDANERSGRRSGPRLSATQILKNLGLIPP